MTYGGNAGSPVAMVSLPASRVLPSAHAFGSSAAPGGLSGFLRHCAVVAGTAATGRASDEATGRPGTRRIDVAPLHAVGRTCDRTSRNVEVRWNSTRRWRRRTNESLTMRRFLSYCLKDHDASLRHETPRPRGRQALLRAVGDRQASPSTTSPTRPGCPRATLYRLFPGGKDVLFEAMRVQRAGGVLHPPADSRSTGAESVEDLLVAAVVHSLRRHAHDEHLALMLASAPGEMVASSPSKGCRASSGWPRSS